MNSITATAPIRAAYLPKSHLHITLRGYTSLVATTGLRGGSSVFTSTRRPAMNSKRVISSTPHPTKIKEFFPPPEAPHIKEITAWAHPV